MKRLGIMLAVLATGAAPASGSVIGVAEAVAMADAASTDGRSGRFQMTVAATGKSPKATFLNSTADYKQPDNLTFAIAPIVANKLAKQYGAPPEEYFKGRTVTVDGIVRREMIVSTFSGRARDPLRWQHTVLIQQMKQLVAIE